MQETVDEKIFDTDVLFGQWGRETRETLCNLERVDQKVNFIQDELVKLSRRNQQSNGVVEFCVNALKLAQEEIRAYWTRQWGEFDPHVEPLAITEGDGGKAHVRVHQLVKSLQGDVLSDSEVLHVFTVNTGLIAAMDLGGEADPTAGPSAAFAHRS
jgi:hypothetical protein